MVWVMGLTSGGGGDGGVLTSSWGDGGVVG